MCRYAGCGGHPENKVKDLLSKKKLMLHPKDNIFLQIKKRKLGQLIFIWSFSGMFVTSYMYTLTYTGMLLLLQAFIKSDIENEPIGLLK